MIKTDSKIIFETGQIFIISIDFKARLRPPSTKHAMTRC